MSTINSWCGRICSISLTLLISAFIIDYKSNSLPLHGLWLVLYVLTVTISTVWVSCVTIQKLLQQNQAYEYDFDKNPYLRNVRYVCRLLQLPYFQTKTNAQPTVNLNHHKNIDDRIDDFTNDIEQRFVTKWYKYVSDDSSFPSESKILLDGVVRHMLQVSVQVDSSKIACGILVILLKHLKEYRKALKRSSKNGNNVENAYRYTHIAINKDHKLMEHYTHRLTANVLREFISWELWNSLPSRLLVAILAKRLTTYAIYYISQPGYVNYRIVALSADEKTNMELNLEKYSYVSLSDVNLSRNKNKLMIFEQKNDTVEGLTPQISPKKETKNPAVTDSVGKDSMIEKVLTKMITYHTAPILQRAEIKENEELVDDTLPLVLDSSPEHKSDDFSVKRSEPVKIHSAKSTNKRWDDNDVGNVSIGQDLLAMDSSDIQGFSGRRLWGPSLNENETDKHSHVLWDINEIFKEKDSMENDVIKEKTIPAKQKSSPPVTNLKISTTNAASIITNTIKPIGTTLHNMREFQQTTINNVSNATDKAIHKIGDLQDEAVGVVEGIFDFGMAGIRKGLRLTGLQDSGDVPKIKTNLQHQEYAKSPKNAPKLVKLPHITSEDLKKNNSHSVESGESVWMNPIAKESPNGFENQMLFEKSPNVIDTTDSTVIPDITTESSLFLNESPEYEETADLASTINKLRSLLQQRSSESSLNTPAASPMPMEEKPAVTPLESNDPVKTDGGMQRFARTVTGMFNTFKGALPGNVGEQPTPKTDQWIYIENETTETDLASLLNSLLVERRDYCTVDTAYEAMDSLDVLTENVSSPTKKIHWETFDDELDDFDSTIPITKSLMDVISECLLDTNCALKQEPVMKAFLVVFGKEMEENLSVYMDKMMKYLNKCVGPLPKNENDVPLAMELSKMTDIILESLPNAVRSVFGDGDMETGLRFLIASLQSVKINQDLVLQMFELFTSQLIYASSQMSPTPSA